VGRQLDGDHRGASGRAADLQPAIHGPDPLGKPGQATAFFEAGTPGEEPRVLCGEVGLQNETCVGEHVDNSRFDRKRRAGAGSG